MNIDTTKIGDYSEHKNGEITEVKVGGFIGESGMKEYVGCIKGTHLDITTEIKKSTFGTFSLFAQTSKKIEDGELKKVVLGIINKNIKLLWSLAHKIYIPYL